MIKFVSDLRQVYSNNQTDRHDITETLLKMALNTITPYSRSKDYLVGSEKLALKGATIDHS
jgi:hypothetical protein